ncbi:MAG TPA: hypothetical protein VM487_14070, partial [Phycisphaerae bacterium]|nr:hypothetical protein [Phycisphaerae bacterium]
MAKQRLVEIVLKGKDESKQAFASVQSSLDGTSGAVESLPGPLGQAQGAFDKLKESMGSTAGKQALLVAGGVALVAGLAKAAQSAYAFAASQAVVGDEFDKMFQRTGIAVETLSEYDFAIRRGGGSTADLETAVRRLARSMGDAQDGIKEAVDAFADLGISTADLVGPDGQLLDISVVMPMIADGLQKVQSQASRMDIAQAILGRGGTRLLPALQQGRAGLQALNDDLQRFGGTMSGEFATASAAFVDAQTNFSTAWQRLKEQVSEPLIVSGAEVINDIAEFLASASGAVLGESKQFETAAESIDEYATALTEATAARSVFAGASIGTFTADDTVEMISALRDVGISAKEAKELVEQLIAAQSRPIQRPDEERQRTLASFDEVVTRRVRTIYEDDAVDVGVKFSDADLSVLAAKRAELMAAIDTTWTVKTDERWLDSATDQLNALRANAEGGINLELTTDPDFLSALDQGYTLVDEMTGGVGRLREGWEQADTAASDFGRVVSDLGPIAGDIGYAFGNAFREITEKGEIAAADLVRMFTEAARQIAIQLAMATGDPFAMLAAGAAGGSSDPIPG